MRPTKVLLSKVPRREVIIAGIDVSYHQKVINWEHVADPECHYSPKAPFEDFKFAIARVSDGKFRDPQFTRNWKAIREMGFIRGCYHYLRPGLDPVEQAKAVLADIDKAGGIEHTDIPPILDVETLNDQSPERLLDDAHAWVDHVCHELQARCVIYTGPAFWCRYLLYGFEDLPLWIAHYRGDNLPGAPAAPDKPPLVPIEQWPNWVIWQHSCTGRIDGVGAGIDVDLNIFNGSVEELRRLITICWNRGAWINYTHPNVASIPPDPVTTLPEEVESVISPPPSDPAPVTVDVAPLDPLPDDLVPVDDHGHEDTDPAELAKRPGCAFGGLLGRLLGGSSK